jgi:small subunit ribosomal protein S3
MGRKVHPRAFRLGNGFNWSSWWFANKKRYKKLLLQDVKLRRELMRRLAPAGIARVIIERSINTVNLTLHVSRPGVAIGRGGKNLEEIKKFITEFFKREDENAKVEIQVEPISRPDFDAYLVGRSIAEQLERRIPHRRVVHKTMERVMNAGAKGIQVVLSGRIAGAEISRTEKYKKGSVPFSTIREDLDFASAPALTKSGYIGVKVWICRP